MEKKVSFYKPKNLLKEKTGIGGLPDNIIISAQRMADAVQFDFQPFAVQKIDLMKNQIKNETLLSAGNDNSVDDFLFDLIPFDVNAKLSKHRSLPLISDHLLKFVETLNHVNVDSHHVIKAHVSAMDIVTKNDPQKNNNEIIKHLLRELSDLCNRYYTKYGIKKESVDLSTLL